MNTGTSGIKLHKNRLSGIGAAAIEWILGRRRDIGQVELRRRQILSAFLLVQGLVMLAGSITMQDNSLYLWAVMLATSAVLLAGYFLSRTRYYMAAVILAIVVPAVNPLAAVIFKLEDISLVATFMWLTMPLLVSGLMLAARKTMIVAGCYIVLITILALLGSLDYAILMPTVIYILVISFFVVAISGVREKDFFEMDNRLKARQQALQALRESEEKFTKAFRLSPQQICITRVSDGKTLEINDSFTRFSGYTREDIVGRTSSEVDIWTKPEDRRKMLDLLKKNGRVYNEEFEFRIKSGEIRTQLFSAEPMIFNGEECLLSITTDITERKKMEKAMEDEATRRRILIEQSRDGIVVLDENGKVYEANQRFADMLGYSPEEVLQLHIFDWEMRAPRQQIVDMMQTIDNSGDHFETQHRRKDGTILDVEVSTNGAMFGGRKLIFAVCRDITERKKMEQAVRESEEKFSKAFHSNPVLVAITTINGGKYVDVNDSYLRRTGYSRKELIGNKVIDLNVWVHLQERERMIRMLKEQGRIVKDEFDFRMKSGEIRTWLFSAEPLTIGGENCLIGVSVDITESKKIEKALKESQEKFSSAFQSSPDAMSISTLNDGTFLEVNDSFTKITGYTREEVVAKNADIYRMWAKEEQRELMLRNLQGRVKMHNEEMDVRSKSGDIRTLLLSTEYINVGGAPCALVVSTDITERKQMEKKLQESEEKFSKAFRASPQEIIITRARDNVTLEVNDTYIRNSGFTREETIGRTAQELGVWATPEESEKFSHTLQERGRIDNEEFEFRNKTGTQTTLVSIEPITIGGEECYISMLMDITKRKKTEELQKAENHILTMLGQGDELSNLLDAILHMGEQNDPTIKASIMLYDASKNWLSGSGPSMAEEYNAILKTGIPVMDNVGSCGTAAYRKQRVVVTDIGSSPFFKPSQEVVATANRSGLYACWSEPIISSDGELLGTIANYSDHKGEPTADNIRVLEWSAWIAAIAIERKKMEKALRESEEKFSIAFHSSPVMIAISTVKSRVFVEANNSYLRAIGYTREEIIGHSVDTVALTWISQDEYRRMINQMRQQHKFTDEEFTFKMKSGEIKQWLCSGEAIEIGGEPCFINVATDITERKLAEEKLKSVMTDLEQSSAQLIATNKELESFSYSVSHDLRSPLRSIDGFSQALLEDYTAKLDEKGQDYLTRIRHASQRMGDLIDGMLKLSRLTRSEMRHEKVDLSGIATEISTRLKETNPDRNVEFTIDNGLSAEGDPQMLRIVLENLLGNAMKFTQKTELARIKFGSSPNGAQKMFYIKDNGAGFDMQFKDKLFGAFQRLHDTADFPGTGIGLATVQRIINRHGGSIRAEAELDKGATFYFSLNKEG